MGDKTRITFSSITSYYPVITISNDKALLLIILNELLNIEKIYNHQDLHPQELQALLVGPQTRKTIETYLERNPSNSQEEKRIEFLKRYYSTSFRDNTPLIQKALDQSIAEIQRANTELFEKKSVVKGGLLYPILHVYSKMYSPYEVRNLEAQLSQMDLAWRLAQKAFGITTSLLEVLSLRLEKDFPETSANCGEMSNKFSKLAQTSAEQIGRNLRTFNNLQGNQDIEKLIHLYEEAIKPVYHSHL